MAKTLNKSGKRLVKQRTKDGRMRSYWVGQKAKPKGQLRSQGQPEKPGFLRRHAGKLALGAALVGAAALNRHKLSGAARGAGLAHNAIQHSGEKVGLKDRASSMFRMAKTGYMSNRGMDRIDKHTDRFKGGIQRAGQHATNYRKGVGADLAHHFASVGGEAAAGHIGSRFGQVAGTAIGGMFGGPAGAGIGGFLGGHAGGFLAGKHTSKHIARGAQALADRMRR